MSADPWEVGSRSPRVCLAVRFNFYFCLARGHGLDPSGPKSEKHVAGVPNGQRLTARKYLAVVYLPIRLHYLSDRALPIMRMRGEVCIGAATFLS